MLAAAISGVAYYVTFRRDWPRLGGLIVFGRRPVLAAASGLDDRRRAR